MKKKLCAVLLMIILCFETFGVYAATVVPAKSGQSYTPGEVSYKVSFSEPLSLNGAATELGETEKLRINANGSASFDMLFREDASHVEFDYNADTDGILTINMEENTYEVPLTAGENTARADVIDRKGSHVLSFSSSCNVTISNVVFTKVQKYSAKNNVYIVSLDEYDTATQTSVVINPNSVALKVNGAFRYIDYDNASLTPMIKNEKLYIPVGTAARAFSIYYEDYQDLGYVFMSNDNIELYSGSKGNYIIKNGVKKDLGEFAVYENGITWVPICYLAEILGRTVGSCDGYTIIDDRICVQNIIKNDSFMKRLASEFAQFDAGLIKVGREYHVSKAPYARDTNNGTINFPFETIQKAADVAQAGDTVIIHEGTYRETVTPKNDGIATAPIIFRAAEGENVVISAFEEVSDFVIYDESKGMYQALIPKSIGPDRNFVLYNGEILREGRHPNTDTSTVTQPHPYYNNDVNVMRATMGDVRILSGSAAANSDIDLNQDEKDYWKGGTFVGMCGEGWTLSYAKITGSKKGEIALQDIPNAIYGINYYNKKYVTDYGFITNHINTVDVPGEWYVDDTTLYMIPPVGADVDSLTVEVKQRQRVVDLTDRKFVQFVDINTRGGGFTMAGDSEMCVLNGGTHKYISHVGYTVAPGSHSGRFYDRDGIYVNKTDAPELGEAGFFSHGINNAFINADISYSAMAGIFLTGLYTYVENNIVAHTNYAGTYPSGITIEGIKWDSPTAKYGGHTIVGNTSWGAGRGTLYLSRNYTSKDTATRKVFPILGCDIGYNHFYYGSVVARDSGVTYMHGTTIGNDWNRTKVHHNVAHDCVTSKVDNFAAKNIYYDGQTCVGENYSNLTFTSYDGYQSSNTSTYLMSEGKDSSTTTQIDFWGLSDLGLKEGGLDSIKPEEYPYQKPFFAGSDIGATERFMLNYEKYSQMNTQYVEDCVLSGGAWIDEDGFARMPSPESAVTTGDMDFYEGGSFVQITYALDKYKADRNIPPKISVTINQDGNEVYNNTEMRYALPPHKDNQMTMKIYLDESVVTGKASITVKTDSDFLRFSKIRVDSCDTEKVNAGREYPVTADILNIGSADEYIRGVAGPPAFKQGRTEMSQNSGNFAYITQSGDHTYVYKNRNITQNVSKATLKIGSGRSYANVKLLIHIGSKDGEVIGEIDVYPHYTNMNVGSVWQTRYIDVDLNRVLPKGTYDFYIENYVYDPADGFHINSKEVAICDQYFIAFY